MRELCFAVAALMAFAALPALSQQATSQFEVVELPDALAHFESLCVATLPEAEAFVAAMNRSGHAWRLMQRSPQEVAALGNAWRSPIGQVSYHRRPEAQRFLQANPSCHFQFRVAENYAHEVALRQVSERFGLGETCTRNRSRNQARWERQDGRGFPIRVFLTSEAPELGVRSARLSISRRLPLDPEFEREMWRLNRCS